MWLLFLGGIAGVLISAIMAQCYWRRSGLDTYESRHSAMGTRVLPSWVFLLNVVSWLLLFLLAAVLMYGVFA